MVDGTEETSARSIDSAGVFGTSSGTWIGEITGAGSPVIKVQCRNSDAMFELEVGDRFVCDFDLDGFENLKRMLLEGPSI